MNSSGVYGASNVSSPFYDSSPVRQSTNDNASRHVYELPDLDGGLYLSKGVVVDLGPQKQIGNTNEESLETAKAFHRKSRPNFYEIPHIHSLQRNPDPQYQLRLVNVFYDFGCSAVCLLLHVIPSICSVS